MLNYLRSDLYRSWKSLMLPGCLLSIVVILAIFVYIAGFASASSPDQSGAYLILGRDFVWFIGVVGFTFGMLPWFSAAIVLDLIAGDRKANALKSIIVDKHARSNYVLSKLAMSLIAGAVGTSVALIFMLIVPNLAGTAFPETPSAAHVAAWWGCAVLVCGAYGFLSVLIGIAMITDRHAAGAWTLTFLLSFGLLGPLITGLFAFAAAAGALDPSVPALLEKGMLFTYKNYVGTGVNLISGTPETLALCVLVPIGYMAASGTVAWVIMSRKSS